MRASVANSPQQEGLLTSVRILELQTHPVQGQFDTAHLREVHRRIFQDLAHHHPGAFRADAPGHFKMRELESTGERHVVGYARGREIGERLAQVLGELRGGDALKGLTADGFAERMGRLYGDLDHIHPFREGNSRTLREFTRELAGQVGYDLDWHSTGADAQTRDRLYIARDREVLERLYPGLDEARSMETEDRREYETFFTLQRLRQHDALSTIIRENVTPHLAVHQEQRSLKGLSLEAFSEAAAQRLKATVQAEDLSPAQVREAAQQLAQEAERRVNLKVITEERLTRDSEAARQGQVQGFERMFQEAAHPAAAQLLGRAMHTLELRGHNPQQLYLTVTQAGQQYEGQPVVKNARAVVIADGEGRHLVTYPASLKGAMTLEDGRVRFTAQDGPQNQMQMEL